MSSWSFSFSSYWTGFVTTATIFLLFFRICHVLFGSCFSESVVRSVWIPPAPSFCVFLFFFSLLLPFFSLIFLILIRYGYPVQSTRDVSLFARRCTFLTTTTATMRWASSQPSAFIDWIDTLVVLAWGKCFCRLYIWEKYLFRVCLSGGVCVVCTDRV